MAKMEAGSINIAVPFVLGCIIIFFEEFLRSGAAAGAGGAFQSLFSSRK